MSVPREVRETQVALPPGHSPSLDEGRHPIARRRSKATPPDFPPHFGTTENRPAGNLSEINQRRDPSACAYGRSYPLKNIDEFPKVTASFWMKPYLPVYLKQFDL